MKKVYSANILSLDIFKQLLIVVIGKEYTSPSKTKLVRGTKFGKRFTYIDRTNGICKALKSFIRNDRGFRYM